MDIQLSNKYLLEELWFSFVAALRKFFWPMVNSFKASSAEVTFTSVKPEGQAIDHYNVIERGGGGEKKKTMSCKSFIMHKWHTQGAAWNLIHTCFKVSILSLHHMWHNRFPPFNWLVQPCIQVDCKWFILSNLDFMITVKIKVWEFQSNHHPSRNSEKEARHLRSSNTHLEGKKFQWWAHIIRLYSR